MYRVVSCCWKRVFAMTSAFSWHNSVSLCPISLCPPRPNLPVTPVMSWLPACAFLFPMMKRTSFLSVSSRRSCRPSSVKVSVKVTQSCPILRDPMDYTVHGIFQARILEWVAISFSRGSSHPRDWTQVSCTAGRFFTIWATRDTQVFIELFKFSFCSITNWDIDLDYCNNEWFALERNRDHSVIFEIAPKYCIQTLLLSVWGLLCFF